jgi:hypothetical protein
LIDLQEWLIGGYIAVDWCTDKAIDFKASLKEAQEYLI